MTDRALRVLVVEDDEDDFILTRELLREARDTRYAVEWVCDPHQARGRMAEGRYDVCLLGYRLGAVNGLDLLHHLRELGVSVPALLLTGQAEREIDLAASRAGAADFLVKGEITPPLLERSIRYAVERSRTERELTRLAHYDQLTGLPNRVLFNDRLGQVLARANRQASLAGVLFLDLDRFKTVNDTLGHSTGDRLLRDAGRRLVDCVRTSDTVARLGGDEFILIFPDLQDYRSAAAAANRIMVRFARPFQIGGRELFITPSIGIALYPFDGKDPETLLAAADTAMYQAKEAGGSSYRFFSSEMNDAALERLALENGLHRALERVEYRLHYQPQYDLTTGALTGIEALLRWQPPDRPLLTPRQFLPLLEETGLICKVGEWVLRNACRQFKAWQAAGTAPCRLAVNLSGRQIKTPGLVDTVAVVLEETGLSGADLELELLEGSIMQDLQCAIEPLRALERAGVRLVMDDFGTGYSALSCLKHLPLSKLKIDRTFISQVGKSPEDEAIVRTIIAMGHSMGLKVIAEGVEKAEQVAFLRAQGCDEGQGFFFGRPLPAEQFVFEAKDDTAFRTRGF